MSERIEQPKGTSDRDLIYTANAQEMQAEDERLRQSLLEKGNFEPFAMWMRHGEQETRGNPRLHAEFLVRAARILNGAGNAKGAVDLLMRAAKSAKEIKGDAAGRATNEENILMLLQEFGGEGAVAAYQQQLKEDADTQSKVELADVQDQLAEAMKELNALYVHDWKETSGYMYSDEERDARMIELKKEVQRLNDVRAKLRARLGLGGGPTKK